MAFGTIGTIVATTVAGGVAKKVLGGGATSSVGGGSAAPQASSGPDVSSVAGLMSPITDQGNITAGILSSGRGIQTAPVVGTGLDIATAADRGTDPIVLAEQVRRRLQEEEDNG